MDRFGVSRGPVKSVRDPVPVLSTGPFPPGRFARPCLTNAEGRDRQLSLLVAALEKAAGAEVRQAGPGTLNGSLAPEFCAARAVK